MPDQDPCSLIHGEARKYCDSGQGKSTGGDDSLTGKASHNVTDLATYLIKKIEGLVAPENHSWAPRDADSGVYAPFLWLGQHLAIAIFTCVVVVGALTAWQGVPRLRQMGMSTGWTLVAVVGMGSVPGIVMMLNQAVAASFRAAIDSDETTLFGAISKDMDHAADAGNPLAVLLIVSALVVALGFATLVFMTRQPGILVFVCLAPLVLASLARGSDSAAVIQWANRLLGLLFAPFALLLVTPIVPVVQGSLAVDSLLLVAADALMLRMIFHGVPYFGPRVSLAARHFVERNTNSRVLRTAVRMGAPDVYEQENTPRGPRIVSTPGRALARDGGALFAAYGGKARPQPGRLTTESAMAKVRTDAVRQQQIIQARREARANVPNPTPAPPGRRPTPTQGTPPAPAPKPGQGQGPGSGSNRPTNP